MTRENPADPAQAALSAIKAILDGLAPEDKQRVERRLFTTRGYFDKIRETFSKLRIENCCLTWALRGRSRRATESLRVLHAWLSGATPPADSPDPDKARKAKIKALRAAGWSYGKLAKKFTLSKSGVRSVLRRP